MERERRRAKFLDKTQVVLRHLAVSATPFFLFILLAKTPLYHFFFFFFSSSSSFVIPITAPPLAGYSSFPFLSFFLILKAVVCDSWIWRFERQPGAGLVLDGAFDVEMGIGLAWTGGEDKGGRLEGGRSKRKRTYVPYCIIV